MWFLDVLTAYRVHDSLIKFFITNEDDVQSSKTLSFTTKLGPSSRWSDSNRNSAVTVRQAIADHNIKTDSGFFRCNSGFGKFVAVTFLLRNISTRTITFRSFDCLIKSPWSSVIGDGFSSTRAYSCTSIRLLNQQSTPFTIVRSDSCFCHVSQTYQITLSKHFHVAIDINKLNSEKCWKSAANADRIAIICDA